MQKDFYDGKSRDYYNVVKRNVVADLLDDHLGKLLDVGGGDGATAQFLIDHGRVSDALVIDPYSRSTDREKLTFMKSSADDPSSFDRLPGTYDTVFFLDVLEHLVNPWGTLDAVRKVHREGGRLVVCMPNARFIAMTVPLVFCGRFDYKAAGGIMDRTHLRWFTRGTTIELIEGAGYRVDRVTPYFEPRVRLAQKLTLGLFRRFLEYQYIVQATKIG